jgi:hypothetical protein
MSDEFAAAADIATGTIIARAVEPEAGEGTHSVGGTCLNCGAALMSHHCHHCGQKAKVHRTLSAFWHDILHSVLHFDGKIWRTLPLLFWKPGDLTRRYIHGERAKFVSPIALFLFMVFFSFAVFQAVVPKTTDFNMNGSVSAADAAKAFAADRADIVKDIAELEDDKKDALTEGASVGQIDAAIAREREALAKLEAGKATELRSKFITERRIAFQKQKSSNAIARLETALGRAKALNKPTQKIEDELQSERAGLKLIGAAGEVLQNGKLESNWNFTDLDFYGSKSLNAATKHALENPQLALYKIQSSAYKYSWALIPISTPFLWLLFFWRRKFKLFDHAVFVTYSLCFMMALGSIGAAILSFATEGSFIFVTTILVLCLFPPIHMYRQLHHAYETSRFGSIWRAVVLSQFALAALILFATLIIMLGVTR